MKIALCSSVAPFVRGGARNIVDWLEPELEKYGHQVERIYLPQVDKHELMFNQMAAYRWIDLVESADRIICFRPPAHVIPHPQKIIWFIHHIRVFYDLWDSDYRSFPSSLKYQNLRKALCSADTRALQEAKKIYGISQVVVDRLKKFNNIDSDVLYTPLYEPERFYNKDFNDEIVCISRVEHHKRQHLLIEALNYTRTDVKLRICGRGSDDNYIADLQSSIQKAGLENKVFFENQWISESRKIELLSECLASAYLPFDEDAYGYCSLEAAYASKPIITAKDSGGVLELVKDRFNGFVCEPDPKALAEVMDELYMDREKTKQMGRNSRERINQLNISWDHVVEQLLS